MVESCLSATSLPTTLTRSFQSLSSFAGCLLPKSGAMTLERSPTTATAALEHPMPLFVGRCLSLSAKTMRQLSGCLRDHASATSLRL